MSEENLNPEPEKKESAMPAEDLSVPKSITYTREDMEVELFMSFGLLNTLLKRIVQIDNVQFIGVDGTVNEVVLLEMLQTRDGKGKVIGVRLTDISDVDVSIPDMEALLEFAREHLLDFSVRTAEKVSAQAAKRNVQLKKVSALIPGSSGQPPAPTKS